MALNATAAGEGVARHTSSTGASRIVGADATAEGSPDRYANRAGAVGIGASAAARRDDRQPRRGRPATSVVGAALAYIWPGNRKDDEMSSGIKNPGVLVGVDGSASSTIAVQWAAREATMRNVPLTLVHAAPPLMHPRHSWPGPQPWSC